MRLTFLLRTVPGESEGITRIKVVAVACMSVRHTHTHALALLYVRLASISYIACFRLICLILSGLSSMSIDSFGCGWCDAFDVSG